jgi:hypothetical protein
MGAADHPLLAYALRKCGVDPDLVEVEWDDLCQEDVLTFACPQLSSRAVEGLADLYLTFPSRFVFASEEVQEAFERAVRNSPWVLQAVEDGHRDRRNRLRLRGLSDFAAYDPQGETLSEFAARAEAAAGLDKASVLSAVSANGLAIQPLNPQEVTLQDFTVLLSLLEGFAHGVTVHVVGHEDD